MQAREEGRSEYQYWHTQDNEVVDSGSRIDDFGLLRREPSMKVLTSSITLLKKIEIAHQCGVLGLGQSIQCSR